MKVEETSLAIDPIWILSLWAQDLDVEVVEVISSIHSIYSTTVSIKAVTVFRTIASTFLLKKILRLRFATQSTSKKT